MKEDLNKGKGIPCVRLEDNIVKMAILPKLIYRFNLITIKIPAAFFFFAEIDKIILKFIRKFKRLRLAETILKKKKKRPKLKNPYFPISKLTIIIKT